MLILTSLKPKRLIFSTELWKRKSKLGKWAYTEDKLIEFIMSLFD